MKTGKILIATGLIVACLFAFVACNLSNDEQAETFLFEEDKIHFLNVGHADCIVITSKNECAIIDAGHGREWLYDEEFPAEDTFKPYLDLLFGENDIKIKFAMATHAHVDHMSGFLDMLEYDDIKIEKFYMKEYNDSGNDEIYFPLVDKLQEKNIPLDLGVENLELTVGNFNLKVYNGHLAPPTDEGENDNSLAILASVNNTKTLLAGDLCNVNGDEDAVAALVGDVDVLKVPHHGHTDSTTTNFMSVIKPELAIITNWNLPKDIGVALNLSLHCGENVHLTTDYASLIVKYSTDGYTLEKMEKAQPAQ